MDSSTFPTFEPFVLTPLDHSLTPLHLYSHITFKHPHPADCIPSLQNGIARLLENLPFLAGNVMLVDELNGKLNARVVKPAPSSTFIDSPMLRVVHHKTDITAPSNDIVQANYLPFEIAFPAADPSPVCRIQANIMSDGIVVSIVTHHMVVDGIGFGIVVESLAACCRGDIPPVSMDEHAIARRQMVEATGPQILSESDYGHMPIFPENPVNRKIVFSSERVSQIQSACNALQGGTPRLSSYDILSALLWICVMRAQQSVRPFPPEKTKTAMGVLVNVRDIMQPPLPSAYIGNAVFVGRPDFPLKAFETRNKTGIDDQEISLIRQVALKVRGGVKSITNDLVGSTLSHFQSHHDWSSIMVQKDDMAVSSLRHLDVYNMTFGPVLGKISNFDIPFALAAGICWILPANPALAGPGKLPPWEMRIVQEDVVMEALHKEPLFRWLSEGDRVVPLSKL